MTEAVVSAPSAQLCAEKLDYNVAWMFQTLSGNVSLRGHNAHIHVFCASGFRVCAWRYRLRIGRFGATTSAPSQQRLPRLPREGMSQPQMLFDLGFSWPLSNLLSYSKEAGKCL